MKMLVIFVVLCALSGCATTEKMQRSADQREYDRTEEVDAFLARERNCQRNGGRMAIKRTGTRIRRAYTTNQMKLARCELAP